MEMEKAIDFIISNKAELKAKIEVWNDLKFKVKTNEEFHLILKRIEIASAILDNL